jgi:cytochrome c oxidase subunit 2
MTSYLPPSERIWWKTPVGKQEIIWIGIALIWCLIMFFMMPYWHIYGKQNLSNEAYQTTPELEKDKSYRIHLSSMDWQHGFSLQPVNINLQILPGYEMVVTMTPDQAGDYAIVCNEYCGIGHHSMLGKIYVKEN